MIRVPIFSFILLFSLGFSQDSDYNSEGEIGGIILANGSGYIPHITSTDGGFFTEIIVENRSSVSTDYYIIMYNSQGELSNGVHSILTGTISANSVTTIPVNQSSPGLDVAHCLLRGEGLSATLSYDYVDGRSSPCHVPASKSFGSKWRIFPGNWDFVFDGLAIVNYDTARSEICISQMDYDGNVIQTEQLATDLPFKAKTKYVIGGPDGSSFEGIDDTYFEVVADTNLGVIALRGTPPGENPAFLWENHAWPVDVLPPEIADFDATYDLSNVTEGYVVHLTIVAYHFHEYVIRFKTNAVEPFIPGVPSMEDGVVRNSIHGFISDAEFVLEVKGPGGTQISEPLFLPIP